MRYHSEPVTEEELRNINAGINDIWKMIKKFLPGDPNDESYWDELTDTCSAIGNKYGSELIQQIILAVHAYIVKEAHEVC